MIWILITLPILMIACWYPGLWLLSRVGGWDDLARYYRFGEERPTQRHRLVSGSVGGIQMRNALEVAVLPAGLYLDVLPFFRPGHPPLCIPWEAVTHVYRKETFVGIAIRLIVTLPEREQNIQITLPGKYLDSAASYLPPAQSGPVGPQYSWRVMSLMYGMFMVIAAFVLVMWFVIL